MIKANERRIAVKKPDVGSCNGLQLAVLVSEFARVGRWQVPRDCGHACCAVLNGVARARIAKTVVGSQPHSAGDGASDSPV